ncbi:hypothetical protein [Ochrobactrum sp. EDr1-4]|uniref:hypothetical protein n=1 Tax=Ochrobactrum sp. EDr1-4 TaxID=3368622 RepID=UPI003B9F1A83
MSDSDILEKFIADWRKDGELDRETELRLRRLVAVFGVQSQPELVRLIGSFFATLTLATAFRDITEGVHVLSDQLKQFPRASVLQHQQQMADAKEAYRKSVLDGEAALKRAFKEHDDAFVAKYATKDEFNGILKQLQKLMQQISNSTTLGLKGWMVIALLAFIAALSFFLGAYFPRWWL